LFRRHDITASLSTNGQTAAGFGRDKKRAGERA
jgi:hypothetical protein